MQIRWQPIAMFFFALSAYDLYANESKTRLQCDVEVVNSFSGGNSERFKERIQLDVETIGKYVYIEANGQEASFGIGNGKIKSVVQIDDFSNENLYSFVVKHQIEGSGLVESQIKLDRVTGRLDYLWMPEARRGMTKKITGQCKKIEATKRRF